MIFLRNHTENNSILTVSQKVVTPVETGVQTSWGYLIQLDSGLRRNDEGGFLPTFYEIINNECICLFLRGFPLK